MPKRTARKVSVMPITKARVNLGALVRRVHLNKEYVISRRAAFRSIVRSRLALSAYL